MAPDADRFAPPAEPPEGERAETSAEAAAPSEPSLDVRRPRRSSNLCPNPTRRRSAPPPLESSAPLEPLPEPAAAAPTEPSPSLRPPRLAPDVFALPLVSEDEPCGPDLDLEGDTEFMNFIAATEGQLPAGYYAFNRASIDFPAALADGRKAPQAHARHTPARAHGKLSILNRDLAGFAQRLGNIAWLVKEHWEAANPRAEGDDYSGRIAQLVTLDETRSSCCRCNTRRCSTQTARARSRYRDQLLATGAAQPRSVTLYDLKGQKQTTEPEKFMPAKSIERVLSDVEIGRLAGVVADAQKARRFDPVDQGGHDRTCRLRERGGAAEAREACRRDDGIPACGAGEARPVARATA